MGNTANLALPYPENTDPLANVAAAIQALANAIDTVSGSAWTAYTCTPGGGLTIGNGTIVAAKRQVGKTMFVRIIVTLGSTSAIASPITLSLPAAAKASVEQAMSGWVNDVSAGGPGRQVATAYVPGGASPLQVWGIGGSFTATSPFTWAVGDKICVGGSYELT